MKQLNRYAKKRKHKRLLQQRYMREYGARSYGSLQEFRDEMIDKYESEKDTWWMKRHPARNYGYVYWKPVYLSGRRKYAKKYSDKRIRQKYRIMIRSLDPEDVDAPRRGHYVREFDYDWTVW